MRSLVRWLHARCSIGICLERGHLTEAVADKPDDFVVPPFGSSKPDLNEDT
jgi:hypothetical protein